MAWKSTDIKDQTGKNIIITGSNSGLGFEAAKILSEKGAKVVMAVRNLEKGKKALGKILSLHPKANLELMHLDLGDLESVQKFSVEFHSKYSSLHLLLNNAGVMFPEKREETKQGFEVQFGTNHLGHYALTGLLLDLIKKTPQARVVNQSSIMHKVMANIYLEDLNWKKSYNGVKAYSQSKLANLLFTYELDRLFKLNQVDAISVAAHPGYSDTNLQNTSGALVGMLNKIIAQKVEFGALPILRASVEPGLKGSEYFGPSQLFEMKGYPVQVKSSKKSHDPQIAKELWEASEKLTGIHYNF